MAEGNIFLTPVTKLKGVGKVRSDAYRKLGIETVGDLLNDYPRAYENRGNTELLTEIIDPDIKHSVILTVATEPKCTRIKRGMTLLKFRAYDDTGFADITYFNQEFLKDRFVPGQTYRFWGKVEKKAKSKYYQMSAPVAEPYDDDKPLRSLVPVYRLTEGITQKQINENIAQAGQMCGGEIPDYLPNSIRHENKLCTLGFALRNIHNPEDYVSLAAAKRRLIFDEFFNFALGLSVTRKKLKERGAPPCADTDLTKFSKLLPFTLTRAQNRVIDEIRNDMKSDIPMSRIIVGDVGCGKTVCAAAAIYICVRNGYQAALMAPTEILARQHFADLSALLSGLGIECGLLCASVPPAKKKAVYAGLENGTVNVVIGTQALLSQGVGFKSPGLLITDEQHRFGVAQRAALSDKGRHAHMLVMSATPIPRSLALALYGDLDMSVIDEMPAGRQRVDTFAVDGSYRERLNGFIRKNVNAGGQVYIVCPAVEEKEKADDEVTLAELNEAGIVKDDSPPLKAAVVYAEELKKEFPDLTVAFVHGKMNTRDKDGVMRDFTDGKIGILVSTTVIEVGINVPNACLMIIENAERFGLSQLHQLRGRVGRGNRKSYCVMVYGGERLENCSDAARKRLDTLCHCYDGFGIAEQDLVMRGPGDFLRGSDTESIRQSGGVRFRIADMCDETGLLPQAFKAAEYILGNGGISAYPELVACVTEMFTLDSGTIN